MAERGSGKRAPAKKKAGYKMPPPMPTGEVLSDAQAKKKWRIGPSIGVGGFGEIYSACDDASTSKSSSNDPYVVKIEPHENGPLFVEKHFYSRNANKEDKISNEWREEHSLRLIELYKKRRILWDPTHPEYKTVGKRADAWSDIADEMNTDVTECKRKMSTLTSTYRRTHAKVKKSRADDEYVPTWFAYKHLDFMSTRYLDKYTVEETTSEPEEAAHKSTEDDSSRSSDQTEESASQESDKNNSAELLTPETVRKRKFSEEDTPNKKIELSHEKDEFDVYGEYIAYVLRNLDTYSMHCVQKVFSDVIFHARTGRYLVSAKDNNLQGDSNAELKQDDILSDSQPAQLNNSFNNSASGDDN